MEYYINKGWHRSFPLNWPFLIGNQFKRKVVFTPSCAYDIGIAQDQINKLFGFSPRLNHHNYSFRYGWSYDIKKNNIKLFAYWYNNSKRYSVPIYTVPFNTEITLGIMINKSVVTAAVTLLNKVVTKNISFSINMDTKIKYSLNFYFGGKIPAPHKIYVHINK